ncbi:unnamed protein product [Sphenostylis stenocarpa]|uniref:pectinesterase n=1 Tax=Sphenostylis stenocarpa TaxID=92480 RepID=A0AA86T4E0_9FABA|nr:unnamed protein product [Sphenostylis stenocarpa]
MLLISCCFFCLSKAIDCGGKNISQTIIVGHRAADFKTIQEAIDSVDTDNDKWVKIHIQAGLYVEMVTIPIEKACIILEGEGSEKTYMSYGDHGSINYNATFTSFASYVIATGITFKGEVDFIYGAAQSFYENCWINALGRYPNLPGFVTAQGRDSADDPGGFVFEGGSITGNGKVNLGRAWRPYSRVIFHKTYFSSIITPQGWDAWNAAGNESRTTYAEVDCKGPGADTSKRVPWMKSLNASELDHFSFASFINKDGWIDNLPSIS